MLKRVVPAPPRLSEMDRHGPQCVLAKRRVSGEELDTSETVGRQRRGIARAVTREQNPRWPDANEGRSRVAAERQKGRLHSSTGPSRAHGTVGCAIPILAFPNKSSHSDPIDHVCWNLYAMQSCKPVRFAFVAGGYNEHGARLVCKEVEFGRPPVRLLVLVHQAVRTQAQVHQSILLASDCRHDLIEHPVEIVVECLALWHRYNAIVIDSTVRSSKCLALLILPVQDSVGNNAPVVQGIRIRWLGCQVGLSCE